jgi:hypothetical protein
MSFGKSIALQKLCLKALDLSQAETAEAKQAERAARRMSGGGSRVATTKTAGKIQVEAENERRDVVPCLS